MTPFPKPEKDGRKKEQEARKSALKEYRQAQYRLAVARDGGCCAVHKLLYGKEVPFDDVHHVYGRGREAGDWREHYTSLLCVCRKCHPQPILSPTASPDLAWVVSVLEEANKHPISGIFKSSLQGN